MTRPRRELISLGDTPYYHIFSRCVRRAFLCGVDHYSGRSYEHRRQWIVERIRLLSSIFAIDLCAYAVMSNHYHLVLKLCPGQLEALDDDQILERWCCLFKGPLLIQQYRQGDALTEAERASVAEIARVWRQRLASISWFMRCLNQPIARQANLEDDCTGKFWECRFTSQALRTEEALLSCMAYVDLNPVRAGMADAPESADYTSIQERLYPAFDLDEAKRSQQHGGDLDAFSLPLKPLLHFDPGQADSDRAGIPFAFRDYLDLVDWTGRVARGDKRGHIDAALPAILIRIRIPPDQWLLNSSRFRVVHPKKFNRVASQFGSG